MDKLSMVGGHENFSLLMELYDDIFENNTIEDTVFLETLKRIFDEEFNKKFKKIKKRKTEYEDEEDEEEEQAVEEYGEFFKNKVVDYLLSVFYNKKMESESKTTVEYSLMENEKKEEYEIAKPAFSEKTRSEVTHIRYEEPVFFNKQWTYQRIFIENGGKNENVYALTMKAMVSNGMKIETKHDEKFNTGYVTSIDGMRDGEVDGKTGKRKYWEYWIINKETGEERIGEKSIYDQKLHRNEMIEWRLATEQESGCGGGMVYDEQLLRNDPTINTLRLPSFMQNAPSFRNRPLFSYTHTPF